MTAMAKKTVRKPRRKKRVVLAIVLCTVLVLAAAALGTLWSLYQAYPYGWQEEIKQNAALYGLDPLFVASVIRTESGWNQDAVSSVGATGLMQIMPDTGKWIAGKNQWEYADGNLKDGAYNIRLGCWYLDYLNKRFGGDQRMLLAAYNAGENKVREWAAAGRFSGQDADIPFRETRNFVKKVMDAYEKYSFLYKER